MKNKKSVIEFASDEGYNPEEFATELLESVVALGMMNLDKQNAEDGASNTQIEWTLLCDDEKQYKITVEKL